MNLKNTFFIIVFITAFTNLFSQNRKEDTRPPSQKEDPYDLYRAGDVSQLDLLEALDLMGVQIHKFRLGDFDKKYEIFLLADEYVHGKLVKTDTLVSFSNAYHYPSEKNDEFFFDYMDQIKIFTKTEENSSILKINTYAFSAQKEIALNKMDNRQVFHWREYINTEWKPDQKIPLMIFASSWLDKKFNIHRFCGVVKLEEGDKWTEELLNFSPSYIVINYKVSEYE